MEHDFLTLINGGAPICTIQRLKAKCDEPLSNFAFEFKLRRYNQVAIELVYLWEKYGAASWKWARAYTRSR
jgi:hypothetical protein